MSLLDVGRRCSKCSTVDFLPFTCPSCALTFCRAHVHSHGCLLPTTTERNPDAGPSTFNRKIVCDVEGCERPRIESIAGIEEAEVVEGIAKQVRCGICKRAFCTTHRSQDSHRCTGPLEVNARQDAFLDRKAKAQKLIAEKFPTKTRTIPQLPPQRDVVKARPKSPDRLPPSVLPAPAALPTRASAPVAGGMKSKAEKLREIELRKSRSLAQPLDSKMRPDGERRFFQWTIGSQDEVENWEKSGVVGKEKKMNKVWVPIETPVGKILDIVVAQSKLARPTSQDPAVVHSIVCLSDTPERGRLKLRMSNESPASALVEGCTVFLVKGWIEK